jgi:hypothetical protein
MPPPVVYCASQVAKIMLAAKWKAPKLITSPASWLHSSCSTWACERELKNAHNSVTVQNRTHVYMKFFDDKDVRKSRPAAMSTSHETLCSNTGLYLMLTILCQINYLVFHPSQLYTSPQCWFILFFNLIKYKTFSEIIQCVLCQFYLFWNSMLLMSLLPCVICLGFIISISIVW